MKPTVSIITTVYNGEKYIDQYFDKLLALDYDHVQLIIINDGSEDKTAEMITANKDRVLTKGYTLIYVEQENAGQAEALSKALPLIEGKYFVMLDIDDYLLENALSDRVALMEKDADLGFLLTNGYSERAGDRKTIFQKPIDEKKFVSDVVHGKYILNLAYIFRTSAFKDINPALIISKYRAGQNLQIILPFAVNCKFSYLDETHFVRVDHSDSHSNLAVIGNYEKKRKRAQELLLIKTESLVPFTNANCWLPRIMIQYNAEDCLNRYASEDDSGAKKAEKILAKSITEVMKEIVYYSAVLIKVKMMRFLRRLR